jgi:hypothetical protein
MRGAGAVEVNGVYKLIQHNGAVRRYNKYEMVANYDGVPRVFRILKTKGASQWYIMKMGDDDARRVFYYENKPAESSIEIPPATSWKVRHRNSNRYPPPRLLYKSGALPPPSLFSTDGTNDE